MGDSNQTYESGVDALLAEYDYDLQSDGRRTGVTEVDSSGNTTRIDWTYDAASRLTQESYNSHDDSLDFITDYLFDLVGNRLSKKTDTNPTFLGDPTFDETVTNTHDANDRLLAETKDHLTDNSQDRHTAYTYDNTQQTQKTIHAGLDDTAPIASETTYAYNLQGRLATVTIDADGNGLSDTRLDYEYNANGIRTSQTKTTDGNNDGDFNDPEDTSERTDYLVDHQNPTGYAQVLEEWLDGQLKTSYTLGHDVLTQAAITGAIHHLLYDGHGSTRMLVDALGLPLSSEIYAYGNPIGFDPENALTSLLYSGEQLDAVTGFQYLRARYYDPATGTFNRLDPFFGNLDDPQSLHKYLYVHADPINSNDPSGLWSTTSMVTGISVGMVISSFIAGACVGAKTKAESNFWWEGFLPGWGSGRGFGANLAEERYGWAALNLAFGILDVFVVGSFFRNIAKGIAQGGLRSLLSRGTITPVVGKVTGTGSTGKHLAYKIVERSSGLMRRFHGTIRDGFKKFASNPKKSSELKGFFQRFLRGDSTAWTKVVEITEDSAQGRHFGGSWWAAAQELTVFKIPVRAPVLSTGMASITNGRTITCVGAWLTAIDRGYFGGGRVFVMVMTDAIASLGDLEDDLDPANL